MKPYPLSMTLAALLATASPALAGQITAEPALDWTALFDRNEGWTGADGIFSIPLSGIDAPGSAPGTQTLFLFSDTAVGRVDGRGRRLPGTTLVNNTLALLDGGSPDPSRIQFYVPRDEAGDYVSAFIPSTPTSLPTDWYWFGDGLIQDGTTYLFAYRMEYFDNGGIFDFATAGVSLIALPAGSRPPFADQRQMDAPLFLPPVSGRGEVTFGAGVMVNTAEAGAPHPDGYVYIYGVQNDLSKQLLAARVAPGEMEQFALWSFWNGADWASGVESAAPITGRVSNELSVTPLPDGRYLLVFQVDALSDFVGIRVGDSPVGPFGPLQRVYECPEPSLDPEIFVYNAKAHPHLSAPGELLISYNVNTFDFFGDFFRYADIYRPRFIRLRWIP